MREATERQKEVINFISRYVNTHKYPPTIREVADHFSISVKGASDHLAALKKKGLLKQGDRKSRTLELVKPVKEDGENIIEIPILGTVAAGQPIMTEENIDGTIKMHRSFLRNAGKSFALRVKGDSMKDAGIVHGDIAIIEQRNSVRNGEIAVVMLEDSVTIKTFYKESTRIRLQPENAEYSPIYCSKNVRVLGKLAHIFRSYA